MDWDFILGALIYIGYALTLMAGGLLGRGK